MSDTPPALPIAVQQLRLPARCLSCEVWKITAAAFTGHRADYGEYIYHHLSDL
jgi:hypothetical protein